VNGPALLASLEVIPAATPQELPQVTASPVAATAVPAMAIAAAAVPAAADPAVAAAPAAAATPEAVDPGKSALERRAGASPPDVVAVLDAPLVDGRIVLWVCVLENRKFVYRL